MLRARTVNDTQKGGMVPPDLVGTAKITFSRLEVYYCVNSSKQRVLFPYCALFFDSGVNANYGEIPKSPEIPKVVNRNAVCGLRRSHRC